NDPVLHGQGPHGQGQGGLPEVHRLLGANRDAHREGGREQISANVLRDRLPWSGRVRRCERTRRLPRLRHPPTSPSAALPRVSPMPSSTTASASTSRVGS